MFSKKILFLNQAIYFKAKNFGYTFGYTKETLF